ncbi:NAD(P)/FAD-dependent oxidoreductase [Gordonia sp. NPDC003429]
MTRTSDVAVIGAGIVGLSAAYQLAEQGLTVTVYETGVPGFGQSAGQSRIFRHAHDDPRLVELAVRARAHWRRWEDELGAPLVSGDGAVSLGAAASGRLAELQRHPEIGAHTVDAHELRTLLPILADFDGPAVFDPGGGSIHTRTAIELLARALGDRIETQQVISLRRNGDGVQVRCPTLVAEHGAAVVCAGRETAALARGVGLDIPVTLGAHVRVSFAVRGEVDRLPTLQDGSGDFGFTGVYAAAYPDRSEYGLGLSDSVPATGIGGIADPDTLARLAEDTSDYVARALPGLDPTPTGIVHCWVTSLPWGDDGVAIWQSGPVFCLAGHNLFKHAPTLGEMLAMSVDVGAVPAPFTPADLLGRSAE